MKKHKCVLVLTLSHCVSLWKIVGYFGIYEDTSAVRTSDWASWLIMLVDVFLCAKTSTNILVLLSFGNFFSFYTLSYSL